MNFEPVEIEFNFEASEVSQPQHALYYIIMVQGVLCTIMFSFKSLASSQHDIGQKENILFKVEGINQVEKGNLKQRGTSEGWGEEGEQKLQWFVRQQQPVCPGPDWSASLELKLWSEPRTEQGAAGRGEADGAALSRSIHSYKKANSCGI